MTTFLLFSLLIITFCLEFFHYKKISKLFFLITIIFFIFIGCGIFSLFTLNKLESPSVNLAEPHWGKNNAIVMLGAGSVKLPNTTSLQPSLFAYSRINETAKLYFSCKRMRHECTIIVSGGDASKTGKSEAIIYQQALIDLGIQHSAILLEPNSMNTYQNTEFTSAILKSKPVDKIFLVTSGLHMKRALLYFAYFDIQAEPFGSDYLTPIISLIPIGYNFAIADFIMHEYAGILRFHIYNALGWNVKKQA